MKNRYTLFRRGNVYYSEDTRTGRQHSLRTRDKGEARRLVVAKNDADRQPMMNLALARTYLSAHDPEMLSRTWAYVMDEFCRRGSEATRTRHDRVVRSKPMRKIRDKRLIETTAADFLDVIKTGGNSTVSFLKTLHNDALGMGWLLAPILPAKRWPVVRKRIRRAITRDEHDQLKLTFDDREWQDYLELLWLTGASQTDAANLTNDNIDWTDRTLSYGRAKLAGQGHPPATLAIGKSLEKLLRNRPKEGKLFPNLSKEDDRSRSCTMWKRCKKLGFTSVSLHSYRYAWAERAKVAGIPIRWAQTALGHNSKAVHEAYARNARIVCPALE